MEGQYLRELEEIEKDIKKLARKALRAKALSQKIEILAAKKEKELTLRAKRIEFFHLSK